MPPSVPVRSGVVTPSSRFHTTGADLAQLVDSQSGYRSGTWFDNTSPITTGKETSAYRRAITRVEETARLPLQVAGRTGATAQDARMPAKHALEACRAEGSRVEDSTAAPDGTVSE